MCSEDKTAGALKNVSFDTRKELAEQSFEWNLTPKNQRSDHGRMFSELFADFIADERTSRHMETQMSRFEDMDSDVPYDSIEQFITITGADAKSACDYLETSDLDMGIAIDLYLSGRPASPSKSTSKSSITVDTDSIFVNEMSDSNDDSSSSSSSRSSPAAESAPVPEKTSLPKSPGILRRKPDAAGDAPDQNAFVPDTKKVKFHVLQNHSDGTFGVVNYDNFRERKRKTDEERALKIQRRALRKATPFKPNITQVQGGLEVTFSANVLMTTVHKNKIYDSVDRAKFNVRKLSGNKFIAELKLEPDFEIFVNENEPTTSVQIRTKDGQRIVQKFNCKLHTVFELRKFIAMKSKVRLRDFKMAVDFPAGLSGWMRIKRPWRKPS